MITVYAYVLDTLADWEMGYVIAELKSGRFFKKGAERVTVRTVGASTEPIVTMGGMKVVPDCVVGELSVGGRAVGAGANAGGGLAVGAGANAGGGLAVGAGGHDGDGLAVSAGANAGDDLSAGDRAHAGDDLSAGDRRVLLLPGADTWAEAKHGAIIEKAREFLAAGETVCAICGATVALAGAGILDARPHTSNGPGFLDMFVPSYKGQGFYVDEPAVADGNLITAGSTAGLAWGREILARLGVFREDTLEAWYAYFSTGKAEHFFALMKTVQGA